MTIPTFNIYMAEKRKQVVGKKQKKKKTTKAARLPQPNRLFPSFPMGTEKEIMRFGS